MAATVAETANDFFKKLRRLWSAVVVGGEKSMMRLLVVIFGMAPASRPQGILQDISSEGGALTTLLLSCSVFITVLL
ncbi:hypothetical protein A259_20235 [Pseudomonas syringae pv. actinidiae ICMP 19070]|uniref:Organic radical activating enzyme n=1 Tax=Pseudomonas syringae pv. actinidiae TaxID=103796 RepID=A0AAN4TLW9_PSESF|nr:hypothetical protein A259_20235 [Pseudomonas syringae pv. actinidiae ICMP 19070]GBH17612.1 Organic radical activating enzyme [Pseudomonas syringae pv. actinidiae]